MLNIKNTETENAVRTLASRLGISLTEAVTIAVRHEMQRLDREQNIYLERLREAAQQVRDVSDPHHWQTEEGLYDAEGMPH
jgi:hypothetical protein